MQHAIYPCDQIEPVVEVSTSPLAWARTTLRRCLARIGAPRGPRRMMLIDKLELGGRRQLLLVECDGQRYLVGAGGDSVHSIAEIHPPSENCANDEKAGWGL